MRRLASLAAPAVLLFALSTGAVAAVDVVLPPKARVLGTIQPEGEIETFSFEATRGTLLTVTVTAQRRSSLDPALVLDGPSGPVALGDAKRFVDRGKKVIVQRLPLDETGSYRIQLSGTGTGQYTLVFTATPQRVWRWPGLDIDGLESEQVDFAAPRNARITFAAKRPRGSTAEPRFGKFMGEGLDDEGRSRPTSHVVPRVPAAQGGDLDVVVKNLADSAGPVNVTITVVAARSRRARIDVRGFRLGAPDGGETATIQVIDAVSGGAAEVQDEDELNGTRVLIPPGVLAKDTPIFIASAPKPRPPTDDEQSAGPAVTLGPAGTTFSSPATVTLHYDPTLLPVGTDIMSDVKVLRVTGKQKALLDVVAVDEMDLTISVPTSGFSTFMPIVPKGPPQLAGREYWNALIEIEFQQEFGPRDAGCTEFLPYDDSRIRRAFGGFGDISFDESTADFTLGEHIVQINHHSYPPGSSLESMCFELPGLERDISEVARLGGVVTTSVGGENETATWSYEPDGQTVSTSFGPDDEFSYTVSEDGSILVGASWEEESGRVVCGLEFAVEKASPAPTASSVLGRYHVAEFALGARGPSVAQPGGSLPVQLFFERGLGTMTLQSGGRFTEATDFAIVETDQFASPLPVTVEKEALRGGGRWSIDGDGELTLTFEEDEGDDDSVTLYPGADGDVWLGVSGGDGELFVILLVRQSQNVTPAKLLGDWVVHGLELEVGQYSRPYVANFPDEPERPGQTVNLFAPDWYGGAFRADEQFRAGRRLDFGTETGLGVFGANSGAVGGLEVQPASESGGRGTWSVERNGTLHYTDEDPFDGFVAPNLLFSITMDRTKVARASQLAPYFGLELRVKPPPR